MDAVIIGAAVTAIAGILAVLVQHFLHRSQVVNVRLAKGARLKLDIGKGPVTHSPGVEFLSRPPSTWQTGPSEDKTYHMVLESPYTPTNKTSLVSSTPAFESERYLDSGMYNVQSPLRSEVRVEVGPIVISGQSSLDNGIAYQTPTFNFGPLNTIQATDKLALYDPGTIMYANKADHIGLVAKYNDSNVKKVEIIDNEREFVFRLEKK